MADQRITASYSSRYTFTGKEQDALTGLHYFGARYYDARISLWYGVDPMVDEMPTWNPCSNTNFENLKDAAPFIRSQINIKQDTNEVKYLPSGLDNYPASSRPIIVPIDKTENK